MPYIYGGGHGKWEDDGYDCSGSVSYALHGAGLLETSMASGGCMKWGDPGPGKWITIYANPGHIYMTVAGLRFRHQRRTRGRHALAEGSATDPELRDLASAGPVDARSGLVSDSRSSLKRPRRSGRHPHPEHHRNNGHVPRSPLPP